ncbi:calcitonin gene-related peptide-receptor component protein [Acyrthosiphon pisum]|uniref:DNA-directed RNA polymerase III subunit RPC9 n=1 Tax=Acyrthosiphon pisum TaxID=7029 RepID=A0A8R1XDY0_ACYPI|nr:calcitonin gene-related peptide-receptor component protein [Acyrthosiphon pisum]|eukprot:NP_001128379.1 calcitonin gene-related peptide-receptor component protein [Acyrthosiphon pisum]
MEVKNPQVAVLCNNEVFELLKKTQENTKLIGGMNHSTILYEVNKYLEQRACAEQNPNKIREFLIKLKHMPINLSKKEKLMLVNDPPDSVLRLSLGIKDFYDRLSEPETEMLLFATKKFSGEFQIITKQELVEEEEEEEENN